MAESGLLIATRVSDANKPTRRDRMFTSLSPDAVLASNLALSATKQPAGTRLTNSLIYDEATDKVVHGFQVFRQCREDGTPTGRESIIVNGSLWSVDLASIARDNARAKTVPMLVAALRYLTQQAATTLPESNAALQRAREALAAAEGI